MEAFRSATCCCIDAERAVLRVLVTRDERDTDETGDDAFIDLLFEKPIDGLVGREHEEEIHKAVELVRMEHFPDEP